MNLNQKLVPTLIAVAIFGILIAAFFGFKYFQTQQQLKNIQTDPSSAQQLAADQAKQLVAQVGKLIDLPQGEDPTVATITDINRLKDQSFFAEGKKSCRRQKFYRR